MPNAQSCQEVLLPESLIVMRVMEMMVLEVSIELNDIVIVRNSDDTHYDIHVQQ